MYSLKSGLTDVTLGAATGCTGVNSQSGQALNGSSIIPYATWNATVGWDPVTGLGLPNFGLLLDALGLSAYNKTATPSCPSYNGTEYTTSTGSVYAIECGTDHTSDPFSTVYVDNLDSCIMACEGTAGCTDVQLSGSACYLKSSLGSSVSSPGAVGARLVSQPTGLHAALTTFPSCPSWNNTIYNATSGDKYFIECGVDHVGGDIGMVYVNNTIQGCVAACEKTVGCVDTSLSGAACYLKGSIGEAVANGNVKGARLLSSS